MSKVKIAMMVSGGGTNMQAVIDAIEKGKIHGEIKVVISSNPKAYALERAKLHKIEAVYIGKEQSAEEIKEKILQVLEEKEIELIVLAGYMSILDKTIIEQYKNRIINIHPSLIPSFCGKGFYGKKVHQAALDYGVKVTGATVHFVDEGIDTGKIIAQEAVCIKEDDTADSLAERVLEVEHKLLPLAIQKVIENQF
ncbi:MAG: phosphoribosylglycinamide formyltransferase [Peptostreptococcales bacterium]